MNASQRADAGDRRAGSGYAHCHHGELLQGAFLDENGRQCLGLVTLPLAHLGTRVEFMTEPGIAPGRVTASPADRAKACRAAALAVEECARRRRQKPCGGHVTVQSDIPVGLGMGSSTSDVIAAVRAVADAFDDELPSDVIARLAVAAELASDPLMLDSRPRLFAQREGRVLEDLGTALPPAVVVGCLTGGGAPVATLSAPAAYSPADVDTFERLRARLRLAVTRADVRLLGSVSTESARAHQRLVRTHELDVLEDIAGRVGAVGVQVAHSGNVAGLLFDPAQSGLPARLRRCVRELDRHHLEPTRLFRTHLSSPKDRHAQPHRRSAEPTPSRLCRTRSGLPSLRDDEGHLRPRGGAPPPSKRRRATG